MLVGRVMGAVASSTKKTELTGMKLLMVKEIDVATLKDKSDLWIGIDTVGAGEGEVVVAVSGSSARQTKQTDAKPTDNSIVAIVDSVNINGVCTFKKEDDK